MLDRRNPYKLDMNQIFQSSNLFKNFHNFYYHRFLTLISSIHLVELVGKT